jgi:hypothetical protein
MAHYGDGLLLPIPKKNLNVYRLMPRQAGRIGQRRLQFSRSRAERSRRGPSRFYDGVGSPSRSLLINEQQQ